MKKTYSYWAIQRQAEKEQKQRELAVFLGILLMMAIFFWGLIR